MFKSELRPAFRLKYFECKKGSLHDGQVLNYVCIQKKCQQKGLICSVCKNDHNGHHVIPLKYLLDKLKNHEVKQMQSQIFQQDLEQLQEIKNGFLFELKSIVEKFAQHIQKIQENIIQLYKNKKVELLNQIEMNMKFNQIIQLTLANNITNQQSFEKDFKIIASLVNTNNQQQNDKNKNDNISFSINLKNIVKQYENNYESFSTKINNFLKDSQPVLQNVMIIKNEQKLLSKQSSSQSNIKLGPNNYKFSATMKGKNMILSNSDKTASCSATGSQRFILVQGPVQKKGCNIRFRIDTLKNWIGLGLGIKNNLSAKKYYFQYNNVGHGSFLLSNNNYSWSHAFKQNNLQTTTFSFAQGNIIKVQINQTQLIYTNETQSNKTYKLPILLNENQWKQACFCVNLCSTQDTVSIL